MIAVINLQNMWKQLLFQIASVLFVQYIVRSILRAVIAVTVVFNCPGSRYRFILIAVG